jgi:molybdenum cofactor cytidylyltransferase
MTATAPDVCCMVLAAGSSSRFGSDKRQALLPDGRTLLEATLANIPPMFTQRILVLHPGDGELAAVHAGSWETVIAASAALGMGHSLAAGLARCTSSTGVLVVLADMPAVQPSTYTELARQLCRDRIVLPRHGGKRGNPVGIGRDFFTDLGRPQGDQGARQPWPCGLRRMLIRACSEDMSSSSTSGQTLARPGGLSRPGLRIVEG